ncbi:MAG: AAA family ATPase [Byssovorax sp.]
MLAQIDISGFKAIKDTGAIDLGPFTLLIGRNGSGKSSLLESLQWLQDALAVGLDEATARFGAFDSLLNRRSTGIELKLTHITGAREVRYQVRVEESPGKSIAPAVRREACREGRTSGARWTIRSRVMRNRASVRSIAGGNPIRDRNTLALSAVIKTKAPGAERLLEFLQHAVFLRLSPAAMAGFGRLSSVSSGSLLDEEGRNLVALLNSLSSARRRWVSEQVAMVIDGVEGIDVVRFNDSIGSYRTRERMRSQGGTKVYTVPSRLLSEGTRRITALFALLAAEPRPSLIAIEEIENGLDPWTLRFVLNSLREASTEGVQILLTTHSPFLLDHVDPTEVLHVRRIKGDTVYEPITSFDDVVKNQNVIAPGAMYLAGYMNDTEEN